MFVPLAAEDLDDPGYDTGLVGPARAPTGEHDGRPGRILSNSSHFLVYNVSNAKLRAVMRATPPRRATP